MEIERWRQIPGFTGYEVSDRGRVRSYWSTHGVPRWAQWSILKPGKHRQGYLLVSLFGKTHAVHRLVMLAFVGPAPAGKNINHKDGCVSNNALTNLEYITHSENVKHAYATGLRKRTVGEASPTAKINLLIANAMRAAALEGASKASIARHFGVSESTVRNVVSGKSWRTSC